MYLWFVSKAAQYLHIQIQHGVVSGIKGRVEDIRFDLHFDAALGEDITVAPDFFSETLPQEFELLYPRRVCPPRRGVSLQRSQQVPVEQKFELVRRTQLGNVRRHGTLPADQYLIVTMRTNSRIEIAQSHARKCSGEGRSATYLTHSTRFQLGLGRTWASKGESDGGLLESGRSSGQKVASWGETMQLISVAVVALLISQSTFASKNFISVTDPAQVNKILSEIPSRDKNLSAVLRRYGLTAESILLSEPDESDVNERSPSIRSGNRFLDINLREPLPSVLECQLFQPISFIFRGGRYLPQTTTANFLFRGKCEAPGK